jgi:hypothetical protein
MVDLEKVIIEKNTLYELHIRSHPKDTIELFFMIPFLSAIVAAELVLKMLEPLKIVVTLGVWATLFYLCYNFTTDRIIIAKNRVQFQKWFIYPFKFTIDYDSFNRQDDCSLKFLRKGKPVLEVASHN